MLQDVLVPSVVKYLPLLPVWLGANALNAALAVVCPVPPYETPNAFVRLRVLAVRVVPLKVRLAEPANAPLLLYWT